MGEVNSLPTRYARIRRIAELRSGPAIAFVIAALLLTMIPPNGVPNDNEEHYFAVALQHVDSDSVPQHSAVLGGMPHAFAFSWIAGNLLEWAGFEATQIIGRLLAIVLYTLAITRLFRALSMSALDAALVLLGFYLAGQYLMGEEWLFRGLEPKVLAYPAVFLALTDAVHSRLVRAFLWLALATYCHFLVGAAWVLFLGLALLVNGRKLRELAVCAAWYSAAVAPLLAYLLLQDYGGAPLQHDDDLPTVGWIISFYRSVHHASPFVSLSGFIAWLPGILATLVILAAAIPLAKQSRDASRLLATLVAVTCVYLLIATVTTAFDHNGFLGPFTIFRPSSLVLFLALTLGVRWAASLGERATALKLGAVGFAFAAAAPALAVDIVQPVSDQRQVQTRFAPLYEYIGRETTAHATFLIEPTLERSFLDFERRTGRALLVLNKFVPASPQDVLEWYRRRLFQDNLFADQCKAAAAYQIDAYQIDYMIASDATARELLPACGEIVFEHAGLVLIHQKNPSSATPARPDTPDSTAFATERSAHAGAA